MKIYQMLHFPLAGAGTGIYVDALAGSLQEKGHQVKVLCADHYQPEKPYPVEAVLFSDGQNQEFDLDFDFPVFASHPLGSGSRFGELDKIQRDAYFQTFTDRIEQQMSEFAPDIIHVHHGWVIASILAGFDVPYVITFHGTEYYAFKEYKDYEEAVLRGVNGAQVLIALTEQEKAQAIDAYGAEFDKIVVIKSGTDTDKFKPVDIDRAALLKDISIKETDRPIVFLGGRLTAQKGVDTLLKAAQIYSSRDPKPITLIAGDGDLREQMEQLAEQLKLDSVYFLGAQSHNQMVKLLNIADIVTLPSIFEPFGLVAVEAMACGTPVIAGNVGGLKQIVNQQVGSLIEPGDYQSLAEKITGFLKSGFKKKAKDGIVAYTRENFSWDRTVDAIEEVYERILHDRE